MRCLPYVKLLNFIDGANGEGILHGENETVLETLSVEWTDVADFLEVDVRVQEFLVTAVDHSRPENSNLLVIRGHGVSDECAPVG